MTSTNATLLFPGLDRAENGENSSAQRTTYNFWYFIVAITAVVICGLIVRVLCCLGDPRCRSFEFGTGRERNVTDNVTIGEKEAANDEDVDTNFKCCYGMGRRTLRRVVVTPDATDDDGDERPMSPANSYRSMVEALQHGGCVEGKTNNLATLA